MCFFATFLTASVFSHYPTVFIVHRFAKVCKNVQICVRKHVKIGVRNVKIGVIFRKIGSKIKHGLLGANEVFFMQKRGVFYTFCGTTLFFRVTEFSNSRPNFSETFLCKNAFLIFARNFPKLKKRSFFDDADLGLIFSKRSKICPKKRSKKRQKRGLFSHQVPTIPHRQNVSENGLTY